MSSLTELFEFLHSPNPDARQLALTNLVGHTAKNSPHRSIFIPSAATTAGAGGSGLLGKDGAGGKPLSADDKLKLEMLADLKVLCRDQAIIAHDAFRALVNLSDTLLVARNLVDLGFLTFLVSYTANTTSPLSPLSAMMLSNISSHPTLTPLITNLKVPILLFPDSNPSYFYPASRSGSSTVHPDHRPEMEEREGGMPEMEAVRALVQAFEDGASEGVEEGKKEAKRKGGVHFLASVFANISMLPQTRPTLLLPFPPFPLPSTSTPSPEDEPLLTKIVVYTEHKDTIRRGGALGCVKNAAMDRAAHPFLLATEDERVPLPSNPSRKVKGVDVLPWVLSPLMGPEEVDVEEMDALPASLQFLGPDKIRERDPVLRLMCVEILMLLATSYTGRETLRRRGTYTVIRIAHEAEKDEKISEHMIRLVGLLKRDEGEDSKKDLLGVQPFGQELLSPDEGAIERNRHEEEEGDSDLEIEVI